MQPSGPRDLRFPATSMPTLDKCILLSIVRLPVMRSGGVHNPQIMHKNGRSCFIGLPLFIIYVHNIPVKIGYARVSTDGQSVAAQVDQLTEAGAEKVFREKVSGAVTHRQQLKRA